MPYKAHLSKDKKLKPIIEAVDVPPLRKKKNVFIYLVGSVMSQQLNIKVADIIYNRFLALYGKREPDPQQVLETPIATLRTVGLSNQKATYIHNIAQFAVEKGITLKHLGKLDDEEVIVYLTQIKGVGRWTVEMLLMGCLGREDVLSLGDYGIQSAMAQLYRFDMENKKELFARMEKKAAAWKPYRSYACRYLWRWKDAGL
jgi:DNA-3-methyladenine glycosylase II